MITARRALATDAAAWRRLRLDALRDYPTAFLTTYKEAADVSLRDYADWLENGHSFIAFDAANPIGVAALVPLTRRRQTRHRAEIGAVYIAPSHHGTPAASTLMHAMEAYARELGIWQLELFVEAANTRAQAFYHRQGFEIAGRLPNAVVGPNGAADDLFLVKFLPDQRTSNAGQE
ncbi:MAG: GNAT family N-acetyltransferase [Pseudomonadota bacterium]